MRFFAWCFFCGKARGTTRISRDNSYYAEYYDFHEECLREVICNPRKHAKYVDTALDIQDAKSWHTKRRAREHRRLESRIRQAELLQEAYRCD